MQESMCCYALTHQCISSSDSLGPKPQEKTVKVEGGRLTRQVITSFQTYSSNPKITEQMNEELCLFSPLHGRSKVRGHGLISALKQN